MSWKQEQQGLCNSKNSVSSKVKSESRVDLKRLRKRRKWADCKHLVNQEKSVVDIPSSHPIDCWSELNSGRSYEYWPYSNPSKGVNATKHWLQEALQVLLQLWSHYPGEFGIKRQNWRIDSSMGAPKICTSTSSP